MNICNIISITYGVNSTKKNYLPFFIKWNGIVTASSWFIIQNQQISRGAGGITQLPRQEVRTIVMLRWFFLNCVLII